jgi:membrane-associated protease RseP (regulator of RpoE activity)
LHIAVPVKINDAGPYRLIFDLGAPINLVSSRFAVEGGLITKESAQAPAFFGMRGERNAKKLQVGDVVAENVQVMVMDHPTIKAISEVLGPVDGIIGYPFFARYKFAIDYPAKSMEFTPSDYKPQNVMNQMFSRMFASRDAKKKRIAPVGLWGFECDRPASDQTAGVVVTRVWDDSPAASAGLQVNDRIITLGGRWTDSPSEIAAAAAFATTGEPVAIEFERDGTKHRIEVTPILGF